jgi:sugar-specific transcriptional regulator TrmB
MMYAANDMQIMRKKRRQKTTHRLKQKAKASRKKETALLRHEIP